MLYTISDNNRYRRAEVTAISKGESGAAPEARLPPCMIGSVCLPLGLFVFAWTNSPRIPWIVSVIFTAPFGFGMVVLFLGISNYLIDAYTIYAASVLAANSVLRSLFGAVFPLFTMEMYRGLGIHWASSVPAFLALACVPFPLLFYRYGAAIRMRCTFARTAAEMMQKLQNREQDGRRKRGREQERRGEEGDKEGKKRDEGETGRDVEKGEGVENTRDEHRQ